MAWANAERRRQLALAAVALAALATGCGSGKTTSTNAARTATAARPDPAEGAALTYAALPYGSPVTAKKLDTTVSLLSRRLPNGTSVRVQGSRIVVQLPGSAPDTPPITDTPQLYFYDWEPNVVGPSGRPAPTEATVTGGSEAGSARFGLTEYQAVLRAARRQSELRGNDSSWQEGCSPRQTGGCLYGDWYLIDTGDQKMVCPSHASHCGPAPTRRSLLKAPAGEAPVKAVRIAPGTILAQALPAESASGSIVNSSPNSYYVLKDEPALSGADLTDPRQAGQSVNFDFTSDGGSTFEKVTREVAHRGQEAQLPGVSKQAALQHFAVVLDGQLVTVPSIDFTRYPEGIDASGGSEISGGFDAAEAEKLAGQIRAADLPVRLALLEENLETTFR